MSEIETKILVAIPMKDPKAAKSRLAAALSAEQRARLARTLFAALVERLKEARELVVRNAGRACRIDIAVVSTSPYMRTEARRHGLGFIEEGGSKGLNGAAELASRWADARGYDALCLLPGDLANPKRADLVHLLSYPLEDLSVAICPSDDLGTNALMLPLPAPIGFGYGDKSFYRHYRAAADAGLMPVVLPLNSLRHDVDHPADLQYMPFVSGKTSWQEEG